MCIFVQDYVETAEQIDCPAPLPESPANALLTEMLVPAPYKAPEKKAEKKAPGIRKGLWRKVVSEASSEYEEAHSSLKGKKKKRRPPHPERTRGLRGRTRGPGKAPGARPSYPRRPTMTRQIRPAEAGGRKKKL